MNHLAIANLLRLRLRSLVTGAGVALAVGMLFCLLAFGRGFRAGMDGEMNRLGAHLIVVPKGCPYDAASIALHGASWPCYLKAEYLKTVQQNRRIAVAAPILMNAVYDTGPTSSGQTVYCGVTGALPGLKAGWHYTEGHFPTRPGEIQIGATLARVRGWKLGDTINLPGLKEARGTVAGILAPTGGADDTFIYLPLADAQKHFRRPDALTHVLVRLHRPDEVTQVADELRGCDAGMDMTIVPIAHLLGTLENLTRAARWLLGSLVGVALLVAGAGVANTTLMAVSERTREIGVLRAIGASRAQVFGLIWRETLLLSVVGGAAGIALALFAGGVVERYLRTQLPFAPTDPLVQPDLASALWCLAVGALLGGFAALLPALRAAHLPPSVAIGQAS